MCEYCGTDEQMYCQDCGRWLCYDVEGAGDDVIGSPYVTASGDLFCSRCGRSYDEADELAADEEWGWWDYNSGYDILDDNAEHGSYIGPGSEVQS